MATIRTTYKFKCDLDKGTLETSLRNSLMQADALADAFAVTVQRNGEDVDISGMTVYGYLYANATKTTVLLKGTISGSTATVILSEDCYAVPGYASLMIQLHDGDVRHTVLKVDFVVTRTGGTLVIDGDNILPTLAELLGQISAMEQATAEARAATAVANQAVDNVEAFKGEIQVDITALSEEIAAKIEPALNLHVFPIVFGNETPMQIYIDEQTPGKIIQGSGFIRAPKNLCIHFADKDSGCYLMFYRKNDETYEPAWDVFKYENAVHGELNHIFNTAIPKQVLYDLPDDVYLQISVVLGSVELYGWDGQMFGLPLSGNPAIVTTTGATGSLQAAGNGSVIIPGTATMAVTSANADIRSTIGVKNGEPAVINVVEKNFFKIPQGYDYIMARLDIKDADAEKFTRMGGVSEYVSVVCADECISRAATVARKTLANARDICDLRWSTAVDLPTKNKANKFKAGVVYNGLPYGSHWELAHYIGWHVSPHTFVNALNDPDSIIHKESVENSGPYYGTVCSAFATMAAGWPYPGTNASFPVDPRVNRAQSAVPPIGSVWSDVYNHCVVPERVDHLADGVDAISAYESVSPSCLRTTRYSNIKPGQDTSGFAVSNGYDYYDPYGIACYHIDADGTIKAPYWTPDDVTVVGGSARPYRGDKSVYTSDMDNVLINIKGTASSMLYVENEDGETQSMTINGSTQLDVKSLLTKSGIYHVYTDADATRESFEYIITEPITYTVDGGKITFSRNDFWYVWASLQFNAKNHPYRPNTTTRCNVPAHEDNDYSDWEAVGKFSHVVTIYAKGEYGAYIVPFTKA